LIVLALDIAKEGLGSFTQCCDGGSFHTLGVIAVAIQQSIVNEQQMDSPSAFNVHKRLKEEFVSNLHGTTMLEVGVLSAIIPAFVIIRGWGALGFASSAVKRTKTNGSDKDLSKPSRSAMAFDFVSKLVLDFMVIFVPTLACLTVCLSLATLVPQLLAALANLFCKDYIPS
jgi:Flp pilus assembly pilin Flp